MVFYHIVCYNFVGIWLLLLLPLYVSIMYIGDSKVSTILIWATLCDDGWLRRPLKVSVLFKCYWYNILPTLHKHTCAHFHEQTHILCWEVNLKTVYLKRTPMMMVLLMLWTFVILAIRGKLKVFPLPIFPIYSSLSFQSRCIFFCMYVYMCVYVSMYVCVFVCVFEFA